MPKLYLIIFKRWQSKHFKCYTLRHIHLRIIHRLLQSVCCNIWFNDRLIKYVYLDRSFFRGRGRTTWRAKYSLNPTPKITTETCNSFRKCKIDFETMREAKPRMKDVTIIWLGNYKSFIVFPSLWSITDSSLTLVHGSQPVCSINRVLQHQIHFLWTNLSRSH